MPSFKQATLLLTLCIAFRSACTATSNVALRNVPEDCQQALYAFGRQHKAAAGQADPDPDHMLYFLHIPRTAGRTFGACFLKQAWAPSRRCAKSYDVLRLNSSVPNCGLLSSHDDYSVIQYLPPDAAVTTQLRHPVDRVLSMYEFAVEVAARSRVPEAPDEHSSKVDTQNVWPWTLLVPFMQQELARRAASLHVSQTEGDGTDSLDPYQNPLVMPLTDFIEHPLAHELVHNGQALQVLGLTNYSHWKEAAAARACVQGSAPAQQLLSSLATKQLQQFVHVGVMDMIDESIAALASTLDLRFDGPAWRNAAHDSNHTEEAQQKADEQAFVEQPTSLLNTQQSEPDSAFLQPVPLWEAYRLCAARARKKNAARRARSFVSLQTADGKHVKFGSDARAKIDPDILARIRELNDMDMNLYEAGKQLLLSRQEKLRSAGRLQTLPQLNATKSKAHQRFRPSQASLEQTGNLESMARDEL